MGKESENWEEGGEPRYNVDGCESHRNYLQPRHGLRKEAVMFDRLVEKVFVGLAVGAVGAAKVGSTFGHCTVVTGKVVTEAAKLHNESIKQHANAAFKLALVERLAK